MQKSSERSSGGDSSGITRVLCEKKKPAAAATQEADGAGFFLSTGHAGYSE